MHKPTRRQAILDRITDQHEQGILPTDDANVRLVRLERVRLIIGKIPRSVRTALNAAVKRGELGHMRRDGLMPEAYYHPDYAWMARQERERELQHGIDAMHNVLTMRRDGE